MTATKSDSPRRSEAEQQRLDNALIELFEERISFNRVLGLKIDSLSPDEVRGSLAMRPELVGHYAYGRLHGGVISATLDVMGALALMVGIGQQHAHETTPQVLGRFLKMATIDLRIDYLRAGLGAHFVATGTVMRLGGRLGSTQARLLNDQGVLLATGTASYLVA